MNILFVLFEVGDETNHWEKRRSVALLVPDQLETVIQLFLVPLNKNI